MILYGLHFGTQIKRSIKESGRSVEVVVREDLLYVKIIFRNFWEKNHSFPHPKSMAKSILLDFDYLLHTLLFNVILKKVQPIVPVHLAPRS